jgi:heptosyltransferase-1
LAAQVLGYSIEELSLDYGLKAAPLFAPWLPQQPYVVCLSATSRDDKLWPENDWVWLGKELNRRGLFCVFPAGSPKERARAARLVAAIPGAVAAPSLALTELARLLAGARAVVGVDTGLTHLAAAVGRPVIALFTASDPVKTGVYASTPIANLGNLGVVPAAAQVLDQLQTWQIV